MNKLKFIFIFTILVGSTLFVNAQRGLRTISESALLTGKYFAGEVWDAQRFPSNPVVGRDWQLSGLKAPYDASTGSPIDWGRNNDRYIMFDLEVDRTNRTGSLTDDQSGRRYNITLKLYDRTGRFIKVISNWGKLVGFGSEGFMYIQEGQLGTFFAVDKVREGGNVSYRPFLAEAMQFSDIIGKRGSGSRRETFSRGYNNDRVVENGRGSNNDRVVDNGRGNNNDRVVDNNRGNNNDRANDNGRSNANVRTNDLKSVFLNAKYSFGGVWDAQRFPSTPTAGRDWRLFNLNAVIDVSTGTLLDWGRNKDRYLQFSVAEDFSNTEFSLKDDVNKNRKKYSVSLKLYEKDGRLVKTVSRYGKLMGFGSGGFMYVQEGSIGTYIATKPLRLGGSFTYRPDVDVLVNFSAILD